MRNSYCRTCYMARKLKITECEIHSLGREKWRGKQKKVREFRNVHCRTRHMSRKMKIMEKEKYPLDDLKNDEITEKREK